jgi:hypothetical protein
MRIRPLSERSRSADQVRDIRAEPMSAIVDSARQQPGVLLHAPPRLRAGRRRPRASWIGTGAGDRAPVLGKPRRAAAAGRSIQVGERLSRVATRAGDRLGPGTVPEAARGSSHSHRPETDSLRQCGVGVAQVVKANSRQAHTSRERHEVPGGVLGSQGRAVLFQLQWWTTGMRMSLPSRRTAADPRMWHTCVALASGRSYAAAAASAAALAACCAAWVVVSLAARCASAAAVRWRREGADSRRTLARLGEQPPGEGPRDRPSCHAGATSQRVMAPAAYPDATPGALPPPASGSKTESTSFLPRVVARESTSLESARL